MYCATVNSEGNGARSWLRCGGWLISLLFVALAASGGESPKAAANRSFRQAQAQYQSQPQDAKAAWQFARACFDLAEFATNRTERADLAEQGIAAVRHALAQDPKSGPAHYYLGLNLGQLARTRTLGALKLVREMEEEFSRAIALDATFDYAGPDRSLGLLYRDAPRIGSIGSRSKARQHLERAVELAPGFPENRLCVLESELKWNDRTEARRELKALEALWPKARVEFTGPAWATSWSDWEVRLDQARKTLEEPAKLESPRH